MGAGAQPIDTLCLGGLSSAVIQAEPNASRSMDEQVRRGKLKQAQRKQKPRWISLRTTNRSRFETREISHNLIVSPAFILTKAADTFAQPTTAPNQLWQTDFSTP